MPEKERFKKVMSSTDILVVAFGAMIGWGWVVSSGRWVQNAGVIGTVIGFILALLLVLTRKNGILKGKAADALQAGHCLRHNLPFIDIRETYIYVQNIRTIVLLF